MTTLDRPRPAGRLRVAGAFAGTLIALAVVVLAVVAQLASGRWMTVAASHGSPGPGTAPAVVGPEAGPRRPPALPALARAQRAHPAAPLPSDAFSGAQARAYAALGLAQDGHPEALAGLDTEAGAALPIMRARLARSSLLSPAPSLAEVAHASDLSARAGNGTGSATGVGHLDLGAVDRGISSGAGGVVLTGTQVWALVRLQPDAGQLAISDQSGGAYVVSLAGDDFSTIRLNGGLVVPGRSYAVGGSVLITGAAPCAVSIRPANAVPTSYPGPLLPSGDG